MCSVSSSRVTLTENSERIQERSIKINEILKKTPSQTPAFLMKGLMKNTLNPCLARGWESPAEENFFETRELFNLAIKGVTRRGGWKLKSDKFYLQRRHIPAGKRISHKQPVEEVGDPPWSLALKLDVV